MKQAWCLAATATDFAGFDEPLWQALGYRVRPARHQGFGVSAWAWGSIRVSTPERRDRLWLLNAFAIALLTLLGADRRGARLRSTSQVKHNQATHPFVVPAGLHALRIDPHTSVPEARASIGRYIDGSLQWQKAPFPSRLPSFSDVPESIGKDREFGEHRCEPFDQRQQSHRELPPPIRGRSYRSRPSTASNSA